jgi:hypothetical protein
MTTDGETMKPHKTPAANLILLALGFLVLNLSGSISAVQAQVQVTAADPASASQGTVNLDVKVTGKGFKKGAAAKFFVTGTTDSGGVQVNSTTFANSGELTANIDVADTAVIANFDIAVTNPDGRGGKGTELFVVTAKGFNKTTDIGVKARFVYCAPPGSDSESQAIYAACVQQNRVRNDVDRDYVNGLEGVAAVFNIVSGSNDLTINLLTLPTRRVVIDLFDMITDPQTYPATPTWHSTPQYAKWFFNVREAYLAKTFCGGSYPCDMTSTMTSSGNVSVDNATYYLQWKPDSVKPVNSPEITSQVNVHYDVINGVEVWAVTPLPNATSQRIVAGLVKELKGSHPGKPSNDPAGQYLVPFTLTVSPQ